MARQNLDIGSAANDGTGDTLRQAAQKINNTFVELYQRLGGDSDALSTQVSLNDTGIVFEGSAADDFETVLNVINPTQDNIVTIPDSTGEVIISTADQEMFKKHLYDTKIDGDLRLHGVSDTGYYLVKYQGAVDSGQDLIINIPDLADSDTFVFSKNTATLTNKTLTAPSITTPRISTSVDDTNGAEILKLTATGSAVNEITIANAASGSGPVISSSGDDTNINLNVSAKGTGAVRVQTKVAYTAQTLTSSGAISLTVPLTVLNSGSALTMTMANGTVTGETKKLINIGAGTATVTPTSYGQGTSFALVQNGAVELTWSGSNWYTFGQSSSYLTIT